MSRHSILLQDSGGILSFGGFIMPKYSRIDMCRAIDTYVINPRYREVLRLKYCEGLTHEQVAEAVNYSTQHVKYICKEYKDYLMNHL